MIFNPPKFDLLKLISPPCDFIISDEIANPRHTLDFDSDLLLSIL